MTNKQEKYLEFVNDIIDKYHKDSRLVNDNEITPSAINNALGNYLDINLGLVAEYQREKMKLMYLENQYDKWYSDAFDKTRNTLNEETTKSTKISLKEIEQKVKVDYQNEFYDWQEKLNIQNSSVSFLRRILDMYKRYDNILTNISQNMRTEMRALNIEDRANSDPQEVKRKRIRRI